MIRNIISVLILVCFIRPGMIRSQNETSKWIFGTQVGFDFMYNPPAFFAGTSINTAEGCASVADAAGNLLFYTDGNNVWNQTNAIMANGTGLGNTGPLSSQGALIVKQPGSMFNYFIFTPAPVAGINGFRYSLVDMNLAAGMGSLTIKNSTLHTPTSEKVTAAQHCNGVDIWVISHDTNNVFRSYLVTAAGINTTAIVSSFPSTGIDYTGGCMKASPNNKNVGLVAFSYIGATKMGGFELYDFDNTTGIISNRVPLFSTSLAYGCEFSPDGLKFYGSANVPPSPSLLQWDLCQNSVSAIQASQYTVSSNSFPKESLQLGPDGKIYAARNSQHELGVINNPNAAGAGCNYVDQGLAIPSGTCHLGLPNFMGSYFYKNEQPFIYSTTQSCSTSFTPQACAGSPQLSSASWNFGDPSSGVSNTSSLVNPSHYFSTPGAYTVQVIRNYNCYSDTLKQTVNVDYFTPTLSIAGRTLMCAGETNVLTASGADLYNWSTASTSASMAITPTQTANYTYSVTGTNTLGNCSAMQVINVRISGCSGIEEEFVSSFKIFPNPTNGILFVENDIPFEIIIYNQFGEILIQKKLSAGKQQIDLQKFDNGIYYLGTKINTGRFFYQRIVKAD